MVIISINGPSSSSRRVSNKLSKSSSRKGQCVMVAVFLVCCGIVCWYLQQNQNNNDIANEESYFSETDMQLRAERVYRKERPQMVIADLPEYKPRKPPPVRNMCPYTSLHDLSPEELRPQKGPRHMITPPQGGKLTHVCCSTTAGPMNILVHHKWAPIGAQRFVEMVQNGYFGIVPFMRCVSKFLCQFGINGSAKVNKDTPFNKPIDDDPNWLPQGKEHRHNEDGVKRFAKGYLAYAGSGKNSRSLQFIVALAPNGPLAGGQPWEVPWGELVGKHSFDTLDAISTEYGENGPPQGRLRNEGASPVMRSEFPNLDYIHSCVILDGMEQDEVGDQ